MRKSAWLSSILLLSGCASASAAAGGQTDSGRAAKPATGALEFSARITPTAARAEPVRQFTFYILTKSYTDIVKEAQERDPVPGRDEFIDGLKFSPELRAWMKAKDTIDLSAPDMDKVISPDDVLGVPEFLLAYQRTNSGGVTTGFPKPKFTNLDKAKEPEKYKKLREQYLAALMKFLRQHPESMTGIELELEGINPQRKWDALQNARNKRVLRAAPELAQLKFLARRADTDMDGHAAVSGLPPGDYWISTLNLEANAGDMHVRWDVPVKIEAGQTARVELSNLNTTEASGANP
ncbi:MAG TPA: carboxypeptidase-like regulatory domain-containing protein [Candidatus Acidoferrum sp.]|nr:carboxypeptidase-like regulatory domain-containing protein [Candidatus Acidoferrum sp.]